MAEDSSARTERELLALRAAIDADVETLLAKARHDLDPRSLVARNPAAVLGAAGAALTALVAAVAKRGKPRRRRDEPLRERAKEAGFVAGSTALTSFATEAAKRLAARLLNDDRR